MLTAEIKINGALLQHLYILNTTQRKMIEGFEAWKYTAQLYDVSSGKVTKSTFWHHREDGSIVCVQKAFESLKKSS
jgi:hypothetical protein